MAKSKGTVSFTEAASLKKKTSGFCDNLSFGDTGPRRRPRLPPAASRTRNRRLSLAVHLGHAHQYLFHSPQRHTSTPSLPLPSTSVDVSLVLWYTNNAPLATRLSYSAPRRNTRHRPRTPGKVRHGMIDNTVTATNYQWQRRGRALVESFVVTVEGVVFGEGTLGVGVEQ